MKRRNFSGQTTHLANMIRTISLSTVLATSFVSTTFAETVSATQTTHYDIAANDLGAALAIFATQSGVVLSFDTDLTKGLKSTDLKGEYSIVQGFEQLLTGTHLQLLQRADGSLTLEKIQAKPQPVQARDMGQLKAIDVTASTSRRAVTNDTNVAQLPVITVNAEQNGSAEDGYLVKNITGVGIWGERSLQDTPYSMTVIPQELIENLQANDMSKIFKMNPLTQDGGDQAAGNHQTVIRGFTSNNPIINGIPLAYYHSFTMMEDLERVETINGATGFLYGGGRVGGAVNYVTKKPTLEDTRTIKIGNYGGDQYYGHLDLSGQIDKNSLFGYRVNTLYQDGDSIADIGKKQKFISVSLDYKPSDYFIFDFNYSHRNVIKTNIKPLFYINTFRPTLDVSQNYGSSWASTNEENDRIISSLKYSLNNIFTLRSAFLYEQSDRQLIGSQGIYTRTDGLYNAYNYKYPSQGQQSKNYSGNIYLDSQFDFFNINHLLTIGYSENYQKYLMGSYAINRYLEGKTLDEIKYSSLPDATVQNSTMLPSSKTQYKNILIGDDITFNNQWSALLGFNYATVIQTSYSSGIKQPAYDKSALTPTLSLIYKPTQYLTAYTTYIESLEQGTIVGDTYSNHGEILDPLISKQHEIGAKYSVLDDKLLFTSALFRIEKANQYSDLATPTPKYVQDGKQVHQGLELTFTGKVTDHLTLIGGGTWMDLSVEKSNNPTLEGKKPTNAASIMAKIYTEYTVPEIEGLTLSGGAYYTGEKYGNTTNTDKIPAYTLFDVGARYATQIAQFPTTFNLTISNLTGKDYWASSTYLGDPRTVAFSVKTQF